MNSSIDYSRIQVTFDTRKQPIYRSNNLAIYRMSANWFALVRLANEHAISWATGTADDLRHCDAELSDWTPDGAPVGGGAFDAPIIVDWPDFVDVADIHDAQMDICPTCGCECELNDDTECYECQIAEEADHECPECGGELHRDGRCYVCDPDEFLMVDLFED